MKTSPAHVVGASFAFSAFAVAIFSGMASGNSAIGVLGKALLALAVCYPCGLLVGWICEYVLRAHVERHKTLTGVSTEMAGGGFGATSPQSAQPEAKAAA